MAIAVTLVVLFSVGIPVLTFLIGWSLPKPTQPVYQRIQSVGPYVMGGALILLGLIAAVVNLITVM